MSGKSTAAENSAPSNSAQTLRKRAAQRGRPPSRQSEAPGDAHLGAVADARQLDELGDGRQPGEQRAALLAVLPGVGRAPQDGDGDLDLCLGGRRAGGWRGRRSVCGLFIVMNKSPPLDLQSRQKGRGTVPCADRGSARRLRCSNRTAMGDSSRA